MKISRINYNKPGKCPGWYGAGWGNAGTITCDGFPTPWETKSGKDKKLWRWRISKCYTCGRILLPHKLKYFEWHTYQIMWGRRDEKLEFYKLRLFMVYAPKVGYYHKDYWEKH